MNWLKRHLFLGMALLPGIATIEAAFSQTPATVNEAGVQSSGIRKLTGKHLVLYTDVPSGPEVDRLPAVFDEAVPLWAAYFGIDVSKTANWQPRGFLIHDDRRFAAHGLMPTGNVAFTNGISIGNDLWFRDQPTDYYRRHLMLHEGTHAFMLAFLGNCGPGWYMEGTAELLGTHQFDSLAHKLALNIMPRSREEVPMLGRIKLIDEARAAHHALGFEEVLNLNGRQRQLSTEAYAWCWAAAKWLDSHPRYRKSFRELAAHVNDPQFNDVVRQKFAADWPDLLAEWQAYIAALDYGYDFERMAIEFEPGTPIAGAAQTVTIAADRGWQSSRAWVEAGKSYDISATGSYQIATEDIQGVARPWVSEPGGVTIEYHDGHPLGMLLGAIDDRGKAVSGGSPTFANPAAIGLHAVLKPTVSGTLYFRVNDSAAHLDDNRGTLVVKIEPAR